MAVEFVFLKGKAKWVTHQAPDKYGNWSLVLYLDPESLEKWNQLQNSPKKVQTKLGQDEDGQFIRIRRPQQKMMRGKVVGFTPPTVLGPDNLPMQNVNIGNGSDVTVKIAWYSFNNPMGIKSYAIRLEAIRVDNLVPYEKQRDMDGDTLEQISGLDQVKPESPGF